MAPASWITPPLDRLVGSFRGEGRGFFPTIRAFVFEEELLFEPIRAETLAYRSRTWRRWADADPDSPLEPSHAESGYVHRLSENELEWVSAQIGGRVEVLRGPCEEIEGRFEIHLESLLVGNDARVISSERTLFVEPMQLAYRQAMATVAVPELTAHVEARLVRLA